MGKKVWLTVQEFEPPDAKLGVGGRTLFCLKLHTTVVLRT